MKGRPAAFWLAVAAMTPVSLTVLNLAADRLPLKGLSEYRDYVIRRNG